MVAVEVVVANSKSDSTVCGIKREIDASTCRRGRSPSAAHPLQCHGTASIGQRVARETVGECCKVRVREDHLIAGAEICDRISIVACFRIPEDVETASTGQHVSPTSTS